MTTENPGRGAGAIPMMLVFTIAAVLLPASGGARAPTGADGPNAGHAAESLDARITEVRTARLVAALDPRASGDQEKLLQAATTGTPYVRYVAARRLALAPTAEADLAHLAERFREADPRFSELCNALMIVRRAQSAPEAERVSIYSAALGDATRHHLRTMLGALYLEESRGAPHEDVIRAAGLRQVQETSPLVQYYRLEDRTGDAGARVSKLIETLEANVAPREAKDPSFPARVQAVVASLIDAGEPAVTALLERYAGRPRPKSEREYLALLYATDVFSGAGEKSALPFLRELRRLPALEGATRKAVAIHRAGLFDLSEAAAEAEAWIESGERFPYHDWLAGWYQWFVVER